MTDLLQFSVSNLHNLGEKFLHFQIVMQRWPLIAKSDNLNISQQCIKFSYCYRAIKVPVNLSQDWQF